MAALLAEFPEMPATVIAERVGWAGSISWFRENVARLRPKFRRPGSANVHSRGNSTSLVWPNSTVVRVSPRGEEAS